MPRPRIVRSIESPEEESAIKRILLQCFEFPEARWEVWIRSVGPSHLRIVLESDEVRGGLAVLPEGQIFGRRTVPSAAIVAVGVPPEHRATGMARDLMAGVLRELRSGGSPLSVLFASTQRLYRSVGYEAAGSRIRYRAGTRGLPRGPLEIPALRLEESDQAPLEVVHAERAARSAGQMKRTQPLWERLIGREKVYRYIFGTRETPEGMILFSQSSATSGYDLDIKDAVTLTPRAARSFWPFISAHTSMSRTVEWEGPAIDPLISLLPENDAMPVHSEPWMLRVVDPVAALEARGYGSGVEARLVLEITDPTLPENSGTVLLTVENGTGRARRLEGKARSGSDPAIRLDIRTLAPLYTGYLPAGVLRDSGRLEADDPAVEAAERIFSGPEPWMPDDF